MTFPPDPAKSQLRRKRCPQHIDSLATTHYIWFQIRRGSSGVEQRTHKPLVGSSNLPPATRRSPAAVPGFFVLSGLLKKPLVGSGLGRPRNAAEGTGPSIRTPKLSSCLKPQPEFFYSLFFVSARYRPRMRATTWACGGFLTEMERLFKFAFTPTEQPGVTTPPITRGVGRFGTVGWCVCGLTIGKRSLN